MRLLRLVAVLSDLGLIGRVVTETPGVAAGRAAIGPLSYMTHTAAVLMEPGTGAVVQT